MATQRRVGAETSNTRTQILDATEQVLVEEGYGAASTRRVAARAGLKPSLVHYYFPTTDDLMIAVYRRAAEWASEELAKAISAPNPVLALWQYTIETTRTALTMELMAMAAHRPVLQAAMHEHADQSHSLQLEAIAKALGPRASEVPPQVLATLIAALGRSLVLEASTGVDAGHDETKAWFVDWLKGLTSAK